MRDLNTNQCNMLISTLTKNKRLMLLENRLGLFGEEREAYYYLFLDLQSLSVILTGSEEGRMEKEQGRRKFFLCC